MRIALCQVEARPLEAASEALGDALDAVAEAARRGADIAVLPEGTYPGYVLGSAAEARAALAAGPDPIAMFGAAARRHEIGLVAGLVVDDGDALRNAAVLFAPDGAVAGVSAKRFLWQFDKTWFDRGETYDVVEVAGARVGAIVCADGRVPEICALLAHRGAQLICDPTAWVAPERERASRRNPQAEYLLRVRAAENGVVVAAASKCGEEAPGVGYTGASQVIDVDGRVLARAGAAPEVVVVDVELPATARRAAASWPILATPTTDLPITARLAEAVVPEDLRLRVWVGSAHAPGYQDAAVSVTPMEVRAGGNVVSADAVQVGRVRIAILRDFGSYAPARAAMLNGADVLVWLDDGRHGEMGLAYARGRAAENRVFVVRAGPEPTVVGPTGAVIADGPDSVGADLLVLEARVKAMTSGTNVLLDRRPEHYVELAGAPAALARD